MPREYTLKSFRAPVELNIDYEAELNAQQFAAVSAPPGPALVLAGVAAAVGGPATAAHPRPTLEIAPGGRHLQTSEGKPFFYLGDTAWALFHRLTREEAEIYLRDRADKGFTVIQAVALAERAAGEEDGAVVVVDVAGRVRRPGVLELPVGSRVVDAIEAAGGARGGVDLSGLNLARVLVDGEQVLVGQGAAAAGVPSGAGAPGAPGAPAALVNLNTADQALLESLPEVGPVTAQAILAWREEHGGFTAVQELLEVDGIGPATLETLAPLVTV